MTEFYRKREIMAVRKPHGCEACEGIIAVGEPALYFTGTAEGDFYACYMHPDCREAEQAWNDHAGFAWDEYCHLWHMFAEGREPGFFDDDVTDFMPTLRERWPAVAARLDQHPSLGRALETS